MAKKMFSISEVDIFFEFNILYKDLCFNMIFDCNS